MHRHHVEREVAGMSGQSHKHSLVEAVLNTASGYVVSFLVWQFVAGPLVLGYRPDIGENFWITNIFTVVSVARSYIWRRAFNWLHTRKA